VKVYSESHQTHLIGHPVRRTKAHGLPTCEDSPCIERKISVILKVVIAKLYYSQWLIRLNQNCRSQKFIMQTNAMQLLRWTRMTGDTIFGVGSTVFAYFTLDLMLIRKNPKDLQQANLEIA